MRRLLIMLVGLWLAGSAVSATDPPLATLTPPQRILDFKTLGVLYPLTLRGKIGGGVQFGVRRDELVTQARLSLRYSYSPAMLVELSHLKILLNNEIIATVSLPKDQAGTPQQRTIDIDPRLLSDYNNLRFELVGHYTLTQCEDPLHSSVWAQIATTSTLQMTSQPLTLNNDLGYLPEPFFDRRDLSPLKLPLVFAAPPSTAELQAAGTLASWFGAWSAWRGARFPILLNEVPTRHSIVLASNQRRPSFLANYPKVNGPALAITHLAQTPNIKLLLILGRDDKDLAIAADALTQGKAMMNGAQIAVQAVSQLGPRQPYDAPNWVATHRPLRFSELVEDPKSLQVKGLLPSLITLNLRLPPDLFIWHSRGVPVALRFRYSHLPKADTSSQLNVSIDEEFLQSIKLQSSIVNRTLSSWFGTLLSVDEQRKQTSLAIPSFWVGNRNQLQFQFLFAPYREGLCSSADDDAGMMGAIDPDSEIDFSGLPHYATLPNLHFFANSGYPFTRMADLSDTAIVLPEHPTIHDLELMMALLGRMGESTGYPARRLTILFPKDIDSMHNKDLLVIGSAQHQPLLRKWQSSIPSGIFGINRLLSVPAQTGVEQAMVENETHDHPALTRVSLSATEGMAALIGLESPLSAKRSVIFATATSADQLALLLEALDDPVKTKQISGSAALIQPGTVQSQQVGPVYHVGELPIWTWAWVYLSQHPLMLACLTVLAVLAMAFALLHLMRTLTTRRLDRKSR